MIFLLQNYSSHDAIFLHVKIWKLRIFLEKNQIFLSTGFPDIWLQTWQFRQLFFFLFFIFIFISILLLPKQGYACASHILSKYLSNRTEILHTYMEVYFYFYSSSSQTGLCVCFTYLIKISEQSNWNFANIYGNECSNLGRFLNSFGQGVLKLGDLEVKKYFEIFSMLFQAGF